MERIVYTALFLFMSACGTLFCCICLAEAENAIPLLATVICIACTWITECLIAISGKLNTIRIFFVAVAFGFVQFIILVTEEENFFGEVEDKWSFSGFGGFLSQALICYLGYKISQTVEEYFESKANQLSSELKRALSIQIDELESLYKDICESCEGYIRLDHLVDLLTILTNTEIRSLYVYKKTRDSSLLDECEVIFQKNGINIDLHDMTLSDVQDELNLIIVAKKDNLTKIVDTEFTKKDCSFLKKEIRAIQN